MKERLKQIIKEYHQGELITGEQRDIRIPTDSKKIITVIGPRRSGKTTLLFQTISQLLETTDKTDTLYMNFEDDRLELEKKDLQLIIEAYQELYPDKDLRHTYFFFDEIQNVDGWEQFVRRINDTITTNIFITGSSAKLLSTEIATNLRGRTLTIEVLPLSFKEHLRFNRTDTDTHTLKGKAKVKKEFDTYLTQGGFPELHEMQEEFKIRTLQNYLEVMIYRDIIERYDLKNIQAVKASSKKFISNIAKEVSIHKTFNELKSRGLKIGKDQLYEFPRMFEDIHLLFFIPAYSTSFSKQEMQQKKVYCVDTGLVRATSFQNSEDTGRLLENTIFIELQRRGQETYYHKEKHECDFVIKENDNITQAIQVCWELNDDNKDRELQGVKEAMDKHKLKEGLLLTHDQEDEMKLGTKKITIRPVWKWMLDKPSNNTT
ncbi:MAG: ATP-binding protein [Candidatus Woesearchaeota archaeon]